MGHLQAVCTYKLGTFRQLLRRQWQPSCIDASRSLGYTIDVERGDMLYGQQLILHKNPPRLASPLERTLQLRRKVSTKHGKQQLPVISQSSIDVELGARGCFRRWERLPMSHWTATARLKLGSPQSNRCYPVMACLLHWVRGD